jgi:tRNA U34 5-methylaminomethyl-2-thiouridine-forming methyltransferase MnmC
LQESRHVFIRQGLHNFARRSVDILEVGFGTGLNALVTLLEAPDLDLAVGYTALEAFPVGEAEWQALGYGALAGQGAEGEAIFQALHRAPWGQLCPITPEFTLHKILTDFREFSSRPAFDLVYFDAFGARVQPELWTEEVFARMYQALRPGGLLVTYAARGSVRRAMQAVGFRTERLPGPPGKREMLRAQKC